MRDIPNAQDGFNKAGQVQEDPLMSLMRAYVEAKREFDDACGFGF